MHRNTTAFLWVLIFSVGGYLTIGYSEILATLLFLAAGMGVYTWWSGPGAPTEADMEVLFLVMCREIFREHDRSYKAQIREIQKEAKEKNRYVGTPKKVNKISPRGILVSRLIGLALAYTVVFRIDPNLSDDRFQKLVSMASGLANMSDIDDADSEPLVDRVTLTELHENLVVEFQELIVRGLTEQMGIKYLACLSETLGKKFIKDNSDQLSHRGFKFAKNLEAGLEELNSKY